MAARIMANETLFLNSITQAEDYIDEDNAKNDKNDLDENKSTCLFYTHTHTHTYIYIYVYMLFCISSILVYYFCITSVFLLL